MEFVQRGCDLGDAKGCVELGVVYYEGVSGEIGVTIAKDIDKAKEIFEQTCDQKRGLGCYKLGMMYDIGEGFDADPKKALELYRSGCSYLDGRSCGMIGHRYLKGGGGVMKSSQEAVRHFELGCVNGDQRSCREMADFYFKGDLVEKNIPVALEMYKQSCGLSSGKACYQAGMIILDGLVGEPNFYEVSKLLGKSCKMGVKEACTASEPIMFQARYEGIVQEAFSSNMCEVWTLEIDDPSRNKQVVVAKKGVFSVLDGEHEGKTFTATHKITNYKEEGIVRVAQSYWDVVSDGKKLNVEHHENWVFERVKVQDFPGDESFSRDPKGNESVYFSRENQTLRRNTSKRCKYVNGITILTTEACSEVQALIGSRLVTKCK
jgi:TPR repeat protein